MNAKVKTVAGIAALVLAVTAAVLAYNTLSRQSPGGNNLNIALGGENGTENTKAPDFSVIDVAGNSVKLSDMEGKPVVINFWASWCPPCRIEMPDFDRVYKDTGAEVKFMMVSLVDGQRETVETASRFINDGGFSFPVYFDTAREAAIAYGIRSIPTTFFIDKGGYIITGIQGMINEETLRRGIDLIR